MASIKNFFDELKSRNVRKTMAIYISTALTTIGISKLFAETYNLPTSIFPIVVTLFACGLGSAMVFGWYHGNALRTCIKQMRTAATERGLFLQ